MAQATDSTTRVTVDLTRNVLTVRRPRRVPVTSEVVYRVEVPRPEWLAAH